MKKSILNIVLLSIFFILGSCSASGNKETNDTNDSIGSGMGDPTIDAGLGDTLDQLGPIDGMDVWSYFKKEISEPGFNYKSIENIYLSSDKFKETSVILYDGTTITHPDTIFDNEIVSKLAKEGTLIISDNFHLYANNGAILIKDKEGYTTLYKQTPSQKSVVWRSISTGGLGKWENGNIFETYYIVKKTDTTLSTIEVNINPTGGYRFIEVNMATAISTAKNYTK